MCRLAGLAVTVIDADVDVVDGTVGGVAHVEGGAGTVVKSTSVRIGSVRVEPPRPENHGIADAVDTVEAATVRRCLSPVVGDAVVDREVREVDGAGSIETEVGRRVIAIELRLAASHADASSIRINWSSQQS